MYKTFEFKGLKELKDLKTYLKNIYYIYSKLELLVGA